MRLRGSPLAEQLFQLANNSNLFNPLSDHISDDIISLTL